MNELIYTVTRKGNISKVGDGTPEGTIDTGVEELETTVKAQRKALRRVEQLFRGAYCADYDNCHRPSCVEVRERLNGLLEGLI